MLSLALALAVVGAAIGGFHGNRAAWPLLVSLALCFGMETAGVSFTPEQWMVFSFALDLGVAATVLKVGRKRDWYIIALFPIAWAFNLADEETRYVGGSVVVILQLLVAFPIRRVWRRAKDTPMPCLRNPFDFMERAA